MFNLITSDQDLSFLAKELTSSKVIAVDTEFRRTSKDNMKLALIQINDNHEIYIIDCIATESCSELLKVFEDSNIVKIFHSCREDIEALYSWTNGKITNIHDTQLANAFLGNELSISYQGIVKEKFGIELKKGETRSNWIRRPLRESQLDYAALDVEYLLDIYEAQKIELLAAGKDSWLKEEAELMVRNFFSSLVDNSEDDQVQFPISKSHQNLILSDFDKIIEKAAHHYSINKALLFSRKNQKDLLRDFFYKDLNQAMILRGEWRRQLIFDEIRELFLKIVV